MTYQDQMLTCRDCGQTFPFTSGEQEFYAQRGYTNQPGRCPTCRANWKAARGGDNYSGGYSSGGGYGQRERAPRPMYPAVCAQCGLETQVPFQPREDRPVYCSECFAQQGGGSRGGGSARY